MSGLSARRGIRETMIVIGLTALAAGAPSAGAADEGPINLTRKTD